VRLPITDKYHKYHKNETFPLVKCTGRCDDHFALSLT